MAKRIGAAVNNQSSAPAARPVIPSLFPVRILRASARRKANLVLLICTAIGLGTNAEADHAQPGAG